MMPHGGYRPEKPAKTELAFAAAAVDPREGALEQWNERFGVTPPKAAKTGTGSNRRRGTAVEGAFGGKGVASLLRAAGYYVVRSQDSTGLFDVLGLKTETAAGEAPVVRAVQAKRLAAFAASGLNDAVGAIIGTRGRLPTAFAPGVSVEAWLYIDGEGWVAEAHMGQGKLAVAGPRQEEVGLALAKMVQADRSRQEQRAANTEGVYDQWLTRNGLK